MIQAFTDYIKSNLFSISVWAFALFMVVRFCIGFKSYQTAMSELKRGMKAIVFLAISLAYLISPIDFIPDVILVIGWIDDAVITIGSVIYAQEALNKVFWGEFPPKNRFWAFIVWYGSTFLLTALIKYIVYIV